MRGVRSLLILLVIAVAVGWFAYRDSQRPPESGPARDKVFDVEADQIESLTVRAGSGDETRLQKTDGEWQIVSPVTAPSDTATVSGVASNLASLEIQRVVDENPPDLGEYGLDAPRVQVSFRSGDQEHALLLGSKAPSGTDMYAKRGSNNTVFLVASHLETTFDRSTFELRDKAVLKVDRDTLDTLELSTGNRTIRFVRPGGEWQIEAPIAAGADYSTVDGLARRLAGLQMTGIVDEAAADLGKYGLDRPAATARLGSGSSLAALAFGSTAPDGGVYARDVSRPVVVTVEASVLDDIKKDLAEYRQKDLFDARSFNTTHVEIVREGQTYAFEKTSVKNDQGQEEQQWRQTSPQNRELDQSTFDALLSAVTRLRADSFVDAAPAKAMAAPHMTIALKFDEGKKDERVTVARLGDDAYAARQGEPGAARVPATLVESIDKALQELK